MSYFPELPKPQPADPAGSMLAGYGAAQEIQGKQSTNALREMQLGQAQQSQSALEEYRKTGDVEKLKTANPKMYAEITTAQAHQRKAETDAMKPAIDLAYTLSGIATEENYGELTKQLTNAFPALGKMLGDTYDPQKIAGFRQAYEKMKKLDDPNFKAEHLALDERRTDILQKKNESDAAFRERKAKHDDDILALDKGKNGTDAQYKDRMAKVAEGRLDYEKNKPAKDDGDTVTTNETSFDTGKEVRTTTRRKGKSGGKSSGAPQAAGRQILNSEPPASENKGKVLTHPDGTRYKSNGTDWVPAD